MGLLPKPADVEAIRRGQRSSQTARLVKRLLDDEVAYADHWLTFWNDLLRNDYAGTGYIDGGRKQITAWLYRALFDNKPYDQFVRELVDPNAESEGFAKGIVWRGNVNASQRPELQFAQNVGQVFLGVNLKCASCHDSFIDNWKLADSYGLAAIYSREPLEINRCDKPTGEMAEPYFLFSELGESIPRRRARSGWQRWPDDRQRERPADADDRQPIVAPTDGARDRPSGRCDGYAAVERGLARRSGGDLGIANTTSSKRCG